MSESINRRRGLLQTFAATAALGTLGFTREGHAKEPTGKEVTLIATLEIAKGKREQAFKYLAALCDAVQKNEPGTLIYAAHTFKEAPDRVIFFEVYESPEALKKHDPGAYDLGLSGEGLFAGPPKIDFLDRFTGYLR